MEILDDSGNILLFKDTEISPSQNKISLKYGDLLKPWSPEKPNLYKLKISLISNNDIIDQSVIPFGVKDFHVAGKQFYLNNQPITLLGGTVVWHRWVRDPEARNLAYDSNWFIKNK